MFQRKDPAQLAAQLEKIKGGNSFSESDSKEWKLALDNAKNGTAVIRFLPGKTENDLPFIKLINHGAQIGPKWYIENCPSTLGNDHFDDCPVCKYIKENDLFNTDNALYQKLKRKTSYWANILVVKDPANPDNEGKVFKYRFGQKVMDKILSMIEVDPAMGEEPVDVTCVFTGANFSLKVKQVGGFSNYDESKFQKQTKIAGIDDPAFQEKLASEMSDIAAIAAPDQFNDFAKNEESFKRVMGTAALGGTAAQASRQADEIASQLDEFSASMAEFSAEPTETNESVKIEQAPSQAADDLKSLLDDL